jgi:hypothetical protein
MNKQVRRAEKLSNKLFQFGKACRIAEREMAHVVDLPGDYQATDDLSLILGEVEKRGYRLNELAPIAGAKLLNAIESMRRLS